SVQVSRVDSSPTNIGVPQIWRPTLRLTFSARERLSEQSICNFTEGYLLPVCPRRAHFLGENPALQCTNRIYLSLGGTDRGVNGVHEVDYALLLVEGWEGDRKRLELRTRDAGEHPSRGSLGQFMRTKSQRMSQIGGGSQVIVSPNNGETTANSNPFAGDVQVSHRRTDAKE